MDATPQRCPPSIVAHRSESDTDSSGAASVWADWDRGSSAHKHRLSNITQETEPECPIKGRWTRHMLKYSLGYREWNDCACAAKGLPNNKTLIQADKKKKSQHLSSHKPELSLLLDCSVTVHLVHFLLVYLPLICAQKSSTTLLYQLLSTLSQLHISV